MILEVGCTSAYPSVATDEERAWLREYLVLKTVAFIGGRPRPQARVLWNRSDGSFPAGLVHLVVRNSPTKVQVLDRRPAPSAQPDWSVDLSWLRDYQLAGVKAAAERERGLLYMSTGSGKNSLAVGLAQAVPVRWGFFVHRSSLVEQAAQRYESQGGLRVGRVVEGRWQVSPKDEVVCASFQSVHAALRRGDPRARVLLDSFEGMIIDECHSLGGDSYSEVAMGTRNARWRIGLSGTPLSRGDRKNVLVMAPLGPVIHRVTATELVERGLLARPRVRMVPVEQVDLGWPTYQGAYGALVVRSAPRNRALVEIAMRCGKPAFLFVKEVDHGRAVAKYLQRAGVKAEFVWGAHSAEWRKELVSQLERGALDIVICSVIFQEGVDVPSLRSIIIGAAGKSTIATIQRAGRGIRKDQGKEEFWVYDIEDRGNKWLEEHSKERAAAYRREGYEVQGG